MTTTRALLPGDTIVVRGDDGLSRAYRATRACDVVEGDVQPLLDINSLVPVRLDASPPAPTPDDPDADAKALQRGILETLGQLVTPAQAAEILTYLDLASAHR